MRDLDPAGYKYRPLKAGDAGWDVYALQTALRGTGLNPGPNDGAFGPRTQGAVMDHQEARGLAADGVAGIVTQRSLTLALIWPQQKAKGTPPGLMRGQIEKESGFILGNHPPRYEDGQYDVGVTQRNTNYATYADGFDATDSIRVLAERLRTKYDAYKAIGKVKDNRRLWELAAGSWNAPSWTDKMANGGTLSPNASQHIEAYIDRVTVYMVV
jgi:peptidoglycan hydrolase-like protein with peptidoglycan-binding domain